MVGRRPSLETLVRAFLLLFPSLVRMADAQIVSNFAASPTPTISTGKNSTTVQGQSPAGSTLGILMDLSLL
jgi:hypothetical protein